MASLAATLAAFVALAGAGRLDPFAGPTTALGSAPAIVTAGSSWVPGEPSLASRPQFDSIEQRAVALADSRWAARQALIAELAAAKRAAAARKRANLLRQYALLRARQLAAYHAALLRVQRLRAQQEAKLEAERKKYQEELAAYMRARTVTPGQECKDPQVRRYYGCQNGLLPASRPKGH